MSSINKDCLETRNVKVDVLLFISENACTNRREFAEDY